MKPLADRIRPQSLDEFVGQKHLVGENKPIRLAIEQDKIFSMIFWGPPGCGKTTLARIIAEQTGSDFKALSAVSAGKDDVRQIVNYAEEEKQQKLIDEKKKKGDVILFLDEIHRFNKAQQDFLLPYVESGTLTLIGATTENPSFEVIGPLLSRCRVFVLNPLKEKEVKEIINRGVQELSKKGKDLNISSDAEKWLINAANADARQVLTLMDNAFQLYGDLSLNSLKEAMQSQHLRFDKKGEEHYNTISAFIKSMRASRPNAALYYLARMVEAGEDPLFIARRMVIFASEDIGVANPEALQIANDVFRACETIGYPECAINLAHGVVHLSTAEKDRASYDALRAAQSDVKKHGNLPIPKHILNAPTELMEKEGYGKGYEKYPDENKKLLPEKLKGKKYYEDKS